MPLLTSLLTRPTARTARTTPTSPPIPACQSRTETYYFPLTSFPAVFQVKSVLISMASATSTLIKTSKPQTIGRLFARSFPRTLLPSFTMAKTTQLSRELLLSMSLEMRLSSRTATLDGFGLIQTSLCSKLTALRDSSTAPSKAALSTKETPPAPDSLPSQRWSRPTPAI